MQLLLYPSVSVFMWRCLLGAAAPPSAVHWTLEEHARFAALRDVETLRALLADRVIDGFSLHEFAVCHRKVEQRLARLHEPCLSVSQLRA